MDITPFIRELLFSHECVIVPGFGGFIGNYASARIDKPTSTFYPPARHISFNRNLKSNDGLLAGIISRRLQVPFGEAVSYIDDFVSTVKNSIEKGEKVVFEKIGIFSNNHEGSIQFEPDRNVNYYPGSFGLESFQFAPLRSYDVRKRISGHVDKDPERGRAARVILWRAAIIVPLIALATIVPLKTSILKPRIETSTFNPITKSESEALAGSGSEGSLISPVTEELLPSSDSDAPARTISDMEGGNADVSSDEGRFLIITGSFRLKENAGQQVALLKQEGFQPEVVTAANGFFRVSAMRCKDLSTAIEKKDSLIKKFPGTWVRKI